MIKKIDSKQVLSLKNHFINIKKIREKKQIHEIISYSIFFPFYLSLI